MKNMPYSGDFKITKLYGTPPPKGIKYSTGKHSGIDLVGLTSKTVLPISSGTFYRAGYDPNGWGNYVVIAQTDGYFAIYAHLSTAVGPFHTVKADSVIGIEGSTGNVTGRHLHLEIRKDYKDKFSTIDPAEYLGIKNKLGVAVMKEKEKEIETVQKQTVSSWATGAWKWATKNGLLDGTRPKDSISREELAIILQRLINLS